MASSYCSKTTAPLSTISIATAIPIATAVVILPIIIGSTRHLASVDQRLQSQGGCWVQRPRWWIWLCFRLYASSATAIRLL